MLTARKPHEWVLFIFKEEQWARRSKVTLPKDEVLEPGGDISIAPVELLVVVFISHAYSVDSYGHFGGVQSVARCC